MKFSVLACTCSTIFAMVSASPTLMKRKNTCTVMGTEGTTEGPCGTAVDCVSAVGSLAIVCSNGVKWNNNGDLPISQTIKASDTGLAYDIIWKQSWQTGGYKSCSAEYDIPQGATDSTGDVMATGPDTIQGKIDDPDVEGAFGGPITDTDSCGAVIGI